MGLTIKCTTWTDHAYLLRCPNSTEKHSFIMKGRGNHEFGRKHGRRNLERSAPAFKGDFIYRLATVTCVTSSGGRNRSKTSFVEPKLKEKQVKKMTELRKFEPCKDSLTQILEQLQKLEV